MLCWAAAEVVAKAAGPGGAERAVQLLQRISPWPPFFHMEEEVLRHTLHVGFSPSGILRPAPGARGPSASAAAGKGSEAASSRHSAGPGAGPFPLPADVAAESRGAAAGAGQRARGLPSAGGRAPAAARCRRGAAPPRGWRIGGSWGKRLRVCV